MSESTANLRIPFGMITAECEKNTIKVTSYENKRMEGYFYNSFLDRGAWFESELQIIWLMENLLDALVFPQTGVEYRSFSKPKRGHAQKVEGNTMKEMITKKIDAPENLNERATFVVQVQFRQNATWQGTLHWVDRDKTQKFRSTLEMLLLMNEALDGSQKPDSVWQPEESHEAQP